MATKHTIYQAKYDATHRRTYGFRLHNELDKDIIDKLASVPSMQGYIKQLIRDDIKRNVPVPEIVDLSKRDKPTSPDLVKEIYKDVIAKAEKKTK